MLETPLICRSIPYFYLSGSVIADENRLEIRQWLNRKFILWEEIHDFYMKWPPIDKPSQRYLFFIEHSGGTQLLPSNLDNLPALLERIEQKALLSSTDKFQFKESRDLAQTPQVFTYERPCIPYLCLKALKVWICALAITLLHGISTHGMSGALNVNKYPVAMLTVLLCFSAIEPLILLSKIPRLRLEQKFFEEQITASKSGIEWQVGADKKQIGWAEVRRYYFESASTSVEAPICVVESARERITFFSAIPNGRALQIIIAQNATNASNSSWQHQPFLEESLFPSTSNAKEKVQVFNYRTPTNQLGLILITLLFLFSFIRSFLNNDGASNIGAEVVNLLLFAFPVLYFWLALFFWRVEIGREGVRYVTVFNQTFIAWNEIKTLKLGAFISIEGENKKIHINQSVAHPLELQNVIAKQSGKAWKKT